MVLLNGCAPAPMPNTPTPPTSVSEPPHDIYAGITDNKAMPFIMIHKSGESLVVTQDINSSNVTGVVWTSADGEAIVIYADREGKPKSTVIGNETILYSNYTSNTVDMTIVHANGKRETFQAKLDTDFLNKIETFIPASTSLVAYSVSNSQRLEQHDTWFYIQSGLYLVSAGTCGLALASGIGIPMGIACGGYLLSTATRVADIYNIDVAPLKSIENGLTLTQCAFVQGSDYLSCVSIILTEAEYIDKKTAEIVSNLPKPPTSTPTPAPPPTRTKIPTRTPRPIPTITSQSISSSNDVLCGQYFSISWKDSSGFEWGWFVFVTPNNVFGLPSSDSLPSEGYYYRIYDTVIDWTPVTYGDGTYTDGSITSFSAYESISSLQSCQQQTQQQPPTQSSTSAQQAQISNEVYFAALRQSPGYSNKNNDVDLLAEIPAGDIVQILGGPEQADGLDWWYVSWNGVTGWLADHTGSGKTIMIFMP